MTQASIETLPSGIRYRHWKPTVEVRATVLLVHGLGGAQWTLSAGCCGPDRTGLGRGCPRPFGPR